MANAPASRFPLAQGPTYYIQPHPKHPSSSASSHRLMRIIANPSPVMQSGTRERCRPWRTTQRRQQRDMAKRRLLVASTTWLSNTRQHSSISTAAARYSAASHVGEGRTKTRLVADEADATTRRLHQSHKHQRASIVLWRALNTMNS